MVVLVGIGWSGALKGWWCGGWWPEVVNLAVSLMVLGLAVSLIVLGLAVSLIVVAGCGPEAGGGRIRSCSDR